LLRNLILMNGCCMKYTTPRPFADPAVAARKLLEIANADRPRRCRGRPRCRPRQRDPRLEQYARSKVFSAAMSLGISRVHRSG
jgi:hypothetical protein